ncbi:MAG TPA: PAC2 family protein [Nitrososphaeraceae archaeon]|nr:PAC2 family protein [Nitrososphaeraceae archaeon]
MISAAGIMGNEHTLTNHAEQVVKVVSTKSAEKLIQGHGFLFLKEGSVSGIPASLLNEGASRGMDEIVLFVSRIKEADFNATALVSKSISRLVPGVHCDISSLMGEAGGVENKIKEIRKSQNYLSPYVS